MTDILVDLQAVIRLNGDTYSSAEVLGMVGRAADELMGLRLQIKEGCEAARNFGAEIPDDEDEPKWVVAAAVVAERRRRDAEIDRLRAALTRIAKQDYDPFAANPLKWPSTIAEIALRTGEQSSPLTEDEAAEQMDNGRNTGGR